MADLMLPGGVVALSGEAADRLLASGSGDAALLYLCFLRRGGVTDLTQAGRTLKWAGERLSAAYDALSVLGLVPRAPLAPQAPPEAPDEPPEYTAEDIAKELEDSASTFPGLVAEVQRRLGKLLSTADLKTLFTLYDFLALPAEVICLLVSYCVEEMERKYGPGRKPRMAQIRREAFIWHRLGIDTFEHAEAHLRQQSVLRTREGAVLAILGVSGRPAVDGERKYIAAWVDMGFPDESIRLAYERTVLKKQSMNWAYMNSILRSWHQKGLHTPAEIEAGDSGRRAPVPAPAQDRTAAPPADDIRWMKEFLEKQKAHAGEEGT